MKGLYAAALSKLTALAAAHAMMREKFMPGHPAAMLDSVPAIAGEGG